MKATGFTIDNSPLPMAITMGPDHNITDVNDAFCDLQGKEKSQIVGFNMTDIVRGAGADAVLGLLDKVYGGESSGLVNNLQFVTASRRVTHKSYMVWSDLTSDADTPSLVIQVTDFTEQILGSEAVERTTKEIIALNLEIVEVNEQLVLSGLHQKTLAETAAKAEIRLRNLVHGLDAVVCEVDIASEQFIFINEHADMFLGYPMDRWTEVGFWKSITHVDDLEAASFGFCGRSPSNVGYHTPFRVWRADGSVAWLRNVSKAVRDSSGNIIRRRCILVDVSDQQQIHQDLLRDLDRSRAIAEAMQYSILWHNSEKTFANLSVAVSYEPAMDEALVGGDFFDAFTLPNKDVMLVLGDVTGKGLKAASRTVEIIFALRAFAHEFVSAGETVGLLNEFICDQHAEDDISELDQVLAVLSVIVIDPLTGVTHAASAGAEPPLILRESSALEEVGVAGLLLGISRDAVYETTELVLDVGDTLLMTTDGITESRRGRDFFGTERVLRAAKAAGPHVSLHDVAKFVVESSREHGGGVFNDDVCLLLARRDIPEPI